METWRLRDLRDVDTLTDIDTLRLRLASVRGQADRDLRDIGR